jgi:hypothetical protein
MIKRRHARRHGGAAVGAPPMGVTVPADKIQLSLQLVVVQSGEVLHQVRGNGHIGGPLAQDRRFAVYIVHHVPGGKAPPIQLQAVQALLPVIKRRLHLVKAVVVVAPEASPPGMVQGINGMILFFQPAAEALLAQRAVAFAAQLIGNVPQDQAGVVAHSVDQVVQQLLYLLAVDGAGQAVVVAHALVVPYTVGLHAQHFGVFACQPVGLCTSGRCQLGINALVIQSIHDLAQPSKVIFPLARLICCPGKHTQRNAVHSGLFHHADVRFKNIRAVQPLIRVIIAAAQHHRGFGDKVHRGFPFLYTVKHKTKIRNRKPERRNWRSAPKFLIPDFQFLIIVDSATIVPCAVDAKEVMPST